MTNRILSVRIDNRSLDPVQAELRVVVTPEALTPATEVRGRLLGPSCPYAGTIEIAYPLLPLRPDEAAEPGTLCHRVVIPEPSLWDPVSPFLYCGPVELWQDGVRADRVAVAHGPRAVVLTPHGPRVNGRPLAPRGRRVGFLDEAAAHRLHDEGVNLLLVPAGEVARQVWDLADRFGFFVLADGPAPDWAAAHACHLDWPADPAARAALLRSVDGPGAAG